MKHQPEQTMSEAMSMTVIVLLFIFLLFQSLFDPLIAPQNEMDLEKSKLLELEAGPK